MDPQSRILLEQTAEALHLAASAGCHVAGAGGNCGVYIGCMYTEYLDSVLGPLVRELSPC